MDDVAPDSTGTEPADTNKDTLETNNEITTTNLDVTPKMDLPEQMDDSETTDNGNEGKLRFL